MAGLERPQTSHRDRALIGARLGTLGDPRPGVGIDANRTPDIAWCAVPGGEVAIEIERRLLPGSKTRRKPVGDFHIARYPITAGQYRAFLEAEDGWPDRQWWGEDLYRDPEGDSYDLKRYANHPALYVSWFDALAFCRWLSARLGLELRLPDEWEWQRAATGGDPARVFPWGTDWDPKQEPHRANTFESRLGAATAVGMYPAGASPTGVLDMAGTVWDWCLNKHDSPDLTGSRRDDFDERVLRGGSWSDYRGFARSGDRYWSNPDYRIDRYDFVGFRVLCSSPIFEH